MYFYRQGAGVYRVNSLVGYTEPTSPGSSVFDGFTYVELELLEDWSGNAPKSAVARIDGGPSSRPGVTKSWAVRLRLGEEIGVILDPPSDDNYGYHSLRELTVFHQTPSGGFSNGFLFTHRTMKSGDIAKLVRRALAGHCTEEMLPDYGAAAKTLQVQTEDPMDMKHVVLEQGE
jgi:hypothetical protein